MDTRSKPMYELSLLDRLRSLTDPPIAPPVSFHDDLLGRIHDQLRNVTSTKSTLTDVDNVLGDDVVGRTAPKPATQKGIGQGRI